VAIILVKYVGHFDRLGQQRRGGVWSIDLAGFLMFSPLDRRKHRVSRGRSAAPAQRLRPN